jgi:hypothetical protein
MSGFLTTENGFCAVVLRNAPDYNGKNGREAEK